MSGILSKKPWPDDSMSDYFIVDKVGDTLVNKATGNVLSNQAGDNSWQERPPGTSGSYEVMKVNGLIATYCPQANGTSYIASYFYIPNVPNL